MLAEAKAGTAYLQFSRAGEHTVLTRAFSTSPAKLISTNPGRAACWVYAATLGGGFVGGDRVDLSADVEDGARALLTTQASTKVYRSLRRSRQSVTAKIGDAALLAVIPDPIVCYARADFAQTQRYELAAGASLVLVDWMTSGRRNCGEHWAFSRYESRVTITRGDRTVFMDAVVLQPGFDAVAARMSGCHVLLTLVITGPLVRDAADELLRRISALPIGPLVAASPLTRGGIVVRMAGTSVEHVGRALRERLAFLDPLIGGDLWSRKW
jgi:urease accessory protein